MLSDHCESNALNEWMKVCNNRKKRTSPNDWVLSDTLLRNSQVKYGVTMDNNGTRMYQNLWDAAKQYWEGIYSFACNACSRREESLKICIAKFQISHHLGSF